MRNKMKLHGLTPVVSLISSAESAEALTLLAYSAEAAASAAKAGRSSPCGPKPSGDGSSYGGSVRSIHPRAHPAFVAVGYYGGVGRPGSSA